MEYEEIARLRDLMAARLSELHQQGLSYDQAFTIEHQEIMLVCLVIRALNGSPEK